MLKEIAFNSLASARRARAEVGDSLMVLIKGPFEEHARRALVRDGYRSLSLNVSTLIVWPHIEPDKQVIAQEPDESSFYDFV